MYLPLLAKYSLALFKIKHFLLQSPMCSRSEIEHALVFKFEPPETKDTNIPTLYPHMIPSDHDQQVGRKIMSTKNVIRILSKYLFKMKLYK